jgi:hypothetical protein
MIKQAIAIPSELYTAEAQESEAKAKADVAQSDPANAKTIFNKLLEENESGVNRGAPR